MADLPLNAKIRLRLTSHVQQELVQNVLVRCGCGAQLGHAGTKIVLHCCRTLLGTLCQKLLWHFAASRYEQRYDQPTPAASSVFSALTAHPDGPDSR